MLEKLWILVQVAAAPVTVIYILAISKWRYSKGTTVLAASAFAVITLVVDYALYMNFYYLLEVYSAAAFYTRLAHIIVNPL